MCKILCEAVGFIRQWPARDRGTYLILVLDIVRYDLMLATEMLNKCCILVNL